MNIKILSDSTCDLSAELLAKNNISLVPLTVVKADEQFKDGVTITPADIFAHVANGGALCSTSANSVGEYADVFAQYAPNYDGIIHINIGSGFSSCYQNACLAAEDFPNVRVIDSQNLSTGVGLQVIEAAEMAAQGKSAGEITAHIKAIRPLVRASFVVDTLTYLHRGGRCSGLAAMMGGALRLHPRIAVAEGKMSPGKKFRGKMDRVILSYAQDMEAELRTARPERVFITHSGCDESVIAEVRAYLEGLDRFEEILVTRAGAVVSSHCGPGTIGVLFMTK